MKITIETGGEPNPRITAFMAFVRRSKKRIIAGAILLIVLLATVWACSEIRESQRKSEEWTRMHNYWECKREEPASYSFSHICAKYNPDSPDYDPKATYTRTPTATP